jgi:hypothetical protein
MKPQIQHLRGLIIAQVFLVLASLIERRTFNVSVPSWLRDIMMNPRMYIPLEGEDAVTNALMLLVLSHVLSMLGLWHLYRPARNAYVITGALLMLTHLLFADPFVTSGVGMVLGQLSDVISGITIALLYFTDLSFYFAPEKATISGSSSSA